MPYKLKAGFHLKMVLKPAFLCNSVQIVYKPTFQTANKKALIHTNCVNKGFSAGRSDGT